MIRTYSELSLLDNFKDRYDYLKLFGKVGFETFGQDRYLNQILYHSKRWRTETRPRVILRDNGCDLGVPGFEIFDRIIIHHMNPITIEQIEQEDESIFDPDFLICTSDRTHQAIHYGDDKLLFSFGKERFPGDTILWNRLSGGK